MRASDVMLCIDPFSYHFERDALFNGREVPSMGDNLMAPYVELRSWFAARGVRVHTADRLVRREVGARINVVVSFGLRARYAKLSRRGDVLLSAFFAFESPVVEPALYRGLPRARKFFKRVFSFTDADALRPLLKRPVALDTFRLPYAFDAIREDLWRRSDRGFLVVLNNNKQPALAWNELYTERLRAIAWFARTGEVDLYGRGWDGPPFHMGIGHLPGSVQHLLRFGVRLARRIHPDKLLDAARRAHRGTTPSKLARLSQYTFCLCFENAQVNGYVTEKVFDCFATGTIPIYLGAPDISRYVPVGSFIDMRQFQDYEELRRFLRALSPGAVQAYREAGRRFMGSPGFRPFATGTFIERLGRIVEEDTGVSLSQADRPPASKTVWPPLAP